MKMSQGINTTKEWLQKFSDKKDVYHHLINQQKRAKYFLYFYIINIPI